ncbi:Protein S100-A10 [Tupaia chinensis]|uniref:Protein S100-A10 n=1 Tax=Tupaia chinensis TaxID=246437 RepID=L9KWP0_TUPCH|nr:Protein S100-A10 [Tupaia chinensis]
MAVDKIMKDLDNCRDSKVGFQSFVSLTDTPQERVLWSNEHLGAVPLLSRAEQDLACSSFAHAPLASLYPRLTQSQGEQRSRYRYIQEAAGAPFCLSISPALTAQGAKVFRPRRTTGEHK